MKTLFTTINSCLPQACLSMPSSLPSRPAALQPCIELTVFLIETLGAQKTFLFANLQPLLHCVARPQSPVSRFGHITEEITAAAVKGMRAVLFVFQFVCLLWNYALLSACCSYRTIRCTSSVKNLQLS